MVEHLLKKLEEVNKTIAVLQYDLNIEMQLKKDIEKQIYEECKHVIVRIKEEGDDRAHKECMICKQWIF